MRKFQFCRYALMIGVCAIFSFRCEKTFLPVDSNEKIDYLQGNTEARVIIKMFDLHSKAPLSGVKVMIIGIDSTLSDSTGTATFDSVRVGNYLVGCTKNGFAGTLDNFSLTIDSNSNTIPIASQSTDVFFMARKGAAVRGNLYYRRDNKIYPVDGATVECLLTNSSIDFQKPLVVTTSDEGAYSFSDLPEYSTYSISVQPFIDGSLNYKLASPVSLAGRAAGDTLRVNDIILEKFTDGNFIVMSHNLETFNKADSLIFEFSEAVDTDLLESDSIYVSLDPSGTRILVKQIWRDSDKKLIIVPFDGAWNNSLDYTLVIRKIKSVTGKPLDNTDFLSYDFSPTVTGALDEVKNVRFRVGASDTNKVDYNTTSITLRWSELENAAEYQIYQKLSSDSSWLFIKSVPVPDTFTAVVTSGHFSLGDQMKFIILGKNSTYVSSFEDATVLTVQDQKGPLINTTSTRTGFNHSGLDYLDTIEITVPSSSLPEPMDTTEKPTVKIKEASYLSGSTMYGDTLYAIDQDKCFWTWTSDRTGIMSVVIDPEKNGTYDSLKIDFTSVTDWAGNKPDTTNGSGYLYYLTRP